MVRDEGTSVADSVRAPFADRPIYERISKRLVDVVGAGAALVLLSPILLLTATAVYATDGGPILFRQVRIGADGRRFDILKFRSMRSDAESLLYSDPQLYRRYVQNDHKLTVQEDLRVTRLGRLLRRSSLDELPQLWNVLKGDMSLVGPRPVLPAELDQRYGELRSHYLATRPGITGLWQVSGRSNVTYRERVLLDTSYVANWSLIRDFTILIRTLPAVARQDGAS